MKHFPAKQIKEAQEFAVAGGQALHTHQAITNRKKAPFCFVRAVVMGEDIAHLFDQGEARLKDTAKRLGVRVVVVERRGRRGQHVDLCGGPLTRALAMCAEGEN